MIIQTWGDILIASFQSMWQGFIVFLPKLFGAVIIFIIGWIIAIALGKLIAQIIKAIKVDAVLAKLGFEEALLKAGLRLDSGAFVGTLVRWFLIIAFLLTAADILELTQITDFLHDILIYIPNVIVASVIILAAALISDIIQKIVKASVEAAGLKAGDLLAAVVKWSIWIFAVLAALVQLGLAVSLINTLFMGIIAMIAIAGGIAFGLGGKDVAGEVLGNIKRDI
ncbi:MAG: hypothetical protein AAB851_03625, partial [Patescibacteria group bacterium]